MFFYLSQGIDSFLKEMGKQFRTTFENMRCLPVVQFATSGSLPRANMGAVRRRYDDERNRIFCVRRCAQNNYHKLFEQFYTAPVPYIFFSFVSISVHVIFRPNGLVSSVPISLKLSTVSGVSGVNTFGGQLSFCTNECVGSKT